MNGYVPEAKSHIACELLGGRAVQISHTAGERSLIASLDLTDHSIQILKFHGNASEKPASEQGLPFSLLGDGELYVTNGRQLLADSGEVGTASLFRRGGFQCPPRKRYQAIRRAYDLHVLSSFSPRSRRVSPLRPAS